MGLLYLLGVTFRATPPPPLRYGACRNGRKWGNELRKKIEIGHYGNATKQRQQRLGPAALHRALSHPGSTLTPLPRAVTSLCTGVQASTPLGAPHLHASMRSGRAPLSFWLADCRCEWVHNKKLDKHAKSAMGEEPTPTERTTDLFTGLRRQADIPLLPARQKHTASTLPPDPGRGLLVSRKAVQPGLCDADRATRIRGWARGSR